MDEKVLKKIIDSKDPEFGVGLSTHPEPGRYVITALQHGNHHGERGWSMYVGYVCQVRKKAGAFGTDLVLLRHPDGSLGRHENQFYYYVQEPWLSILRAMYQDGMAYGEFDGPELEYTLGGEYPETGAVIEPKEDGPPKDNTPLAKITIKKSDGSEDVHIV